MPRVTPITTKEQVAPEHRPIFDAVAEGRGSVRGPFSIMRTLQHHADPSAS